MSSEPPAVRLRPMTADDVDTLRPWFTEPATRRWLGGEDWPEMVLRLAAETSARHALVALQGGEVVGLVDVEVGENGTALPALVVAPHRRRRGLGRAILRALAADPRLASARRIEAGVEEGNLASEALVRACGFRALADSPDEQGFTYYDVDPASLHAGISPGR